MHPRFKPLHETIPRLSQLAQRQMPVDLPGLGHCNPLRAIDACVPTERIGHKTGDGELDQVTGTE